MHGEGVRSLVHERRAGYLYGQGEENERVGWRGAERISRRRPVRLSIRSRYGSAKVVVLLGLHGGGGESRIWHEGRKFQKANGFQGCCRNAVNLT